MAAAAAAAAETWFMDRTSMLVSQYVEVKKLADIQFKMCSYIAVG